MDGRQTAQSRHWIQQTSLRFLLMTEQSSMRSSVNTLTTHILIQDPTGIKMVSILTHISMPMQSSILIMSCIFLQDEQLVIDR